MNFKLVLKLWIGFESTKFTKNTNSNKHLSILPFPVCLKLYDYHVCLDYGIYMSSSKSVQSLENCSLHFIADPDDQN